MNLTHNPVVDPREIRRQLGLNQKEFWNKIGVTQGGGSRYETGRRMPKPVQELLRVVHVEQIDLSKIQRIEVEMIEHLKANEPSFYKRLCDENTNPVQRTAAPGQRVVRPASKLQRPPAGIDPTDIAIEEFQPEMEDDIFEVASMSNQETSGPSSALHEKSHAFHAKRRY